MTDIVHYLVPLSRIHTKKRRTNSVVISLLANYTDRATAEVGEDRADFCGQMVLRGQSNGSLRPLIG
jgi:hypothetical protein